jgi:hypothetical protein
LNDSITINGETYGADDLKLLMGADEISEPKSYVLLLAKILKNPMRLPWFLKEICSLCMEEQDQREMRLGLIRIQVDAELRMNQDIQRFQQRRYVAQVIEVLLFNDLMLAPRDTVEEGDVE